MQGIIYVLIYLIMRVPPHFNPTHAENHSPDPCICISFQIPEHDVKWWWDSYWDLLFLVWGIVISVSFDSVCISFFNNHISKVQFDLFGSFLLQSLFWLQLFEFFAFESLRQYQSVWMWLYHHIWCLLCCYDTYMYIISHCGL